MGISLKHEGNGARMKPLTTRPSNYSCIALASPGLTSYILIVSEFRLVVGG